MGRYGDSKPHQLGSPESSNLLNSHASNLETAPR